MGIEEILAALQAIIDGAVGTNGQPRRLTDEEVTQYEALEVDLAAARSGRASSASKPPTG
jgi:hypothetical protein